MPSGRTSPLAVYVDLIQEEPGHQVEWARLFSAGNTANIRFVSAEADANCILTTRSPWHFGAGGRQRGYREPATDAVPRFVWDSSDQPAGCEPGLYCSLPRQLYHPHRHRTFCYPITYNECVAPYELADAARLIGFVGGITSGLRARLCDELRRRGRADEMLLEVQGGPWHAMFDRSGLAVKKNYAEACGARGFFSAHEATASAACACLKP